MLKNLFFTIGTGFVFLQNNPRVVNYFVDVLDKIGNNIESIADMLESVSK